MAEDRAVAAADATHGRATAPASRAGAVLEVLGVALRLGLTSFGGPIAHIGYFRAEYVQRRGWVDEATFADLVALAQFLPGAASSKLGIMLGTLRVGLWGGLAAWVGFTLPSAIALVIFAYGARSIGPEAAGWLHGLKIVAVAVVAQAVWSMARNLAWDRSRGTIALLAAAATLAFPSNAAAQVVVIVIAGLLGLRFLGSMAIEDRPHIRVPIGRTIAFSALGVYLVLLVLLPLLRQAFSLQPIAVVDSFFRSGALVFGGGHVVLPLLQAEVVPPGWVTGEQFFAGYGAAQAVPGPLFTFAAYLGAVMGPRPNGVAGAALALVAIFLPSFLLVVGALPFWAAVRGRSGFQQALRGINAAVVGLLLAALYHPIWTSAIRSPADVGLALAAFGLLAFWKAPAWLVVIFAAGGGTLISLVA